MKASIALLVLSLAGASLAAHPAARIVGGSPAPEGKYPYQVSIAYNGTHNCGGSILNDRYILTAAHCVYGVPLNLTNVTYGINDIKGPNITWHKAEKLIPHELYTPGKLANDVGLIKLIDKIVFNPKVQPIKLPTSDNLEGSYPAVASGWGRLTAGGITPTKLQQITVNVIPHTQCAAIWSNLATRSHICTYTQRGEGMCNGDSGGALVAGNNQVGIVSFGRPCAIGYPDVFTRVYHFLDWIETNSK